MKQAADSAEYWREFLVKLGVDLPSRESLPRSDQQAKWPSSKSFLPEGMAVIPHEGEINRR